MKQQIITNYFPSKKRGLELEPPSKRRKIEQLNSDATAKDVITSNLSYTLSNFSTHSPVKSEFSPSEIKEKIGKVNKLSDLQARLKLLVSPTKTPCITSQESSILINLNHTDSTKHRNSPQKNSTKPAYDRFNYLVPQSSDLFPIPTSYKKLAKIFSTVDQIVSIKNNRHEAVCVHDLKLPVQNVIRCEFNLNHLEQIRTVFPSSFMFTWEKRKGKFGKLMDDYDLLISANEMYSRSRDESINPVSIRRQSSTKFLVDRKKIFWDKLLSLTGKYHEQFLLTLNPPIIINNERLVRWHRGFDPDNFCPNIKCTPLPSKPQIEKKLSAEEIMVKNVIREDIIKGNNNSDLEKKDDSTIGIEKFEKSICERHLNDQFRGLNPNLVKKIIDKEKHNSEKEITEDIKRNQEIKKIDDLIEVARLLRNRLISDKKAALPMEYACTKLIECIGFGSLNEMKKSLRLLAKIVPHFLKLIILRKIEYIKIDKKIPIVDIENSILIYKNEVQ